MPAILFPAAVRIAFVPFCVESLSRTEIDRVFKAHGVALKPDIMPYAKTALVDAYCERLDWSDEQDVQRFRDIVGNVFSLGGDSEKTAQARTTFLSVCARHGVAVENDRLVISAPTASATKSQSAGPARNFEIRTVLFLASSTIEPAKLRLDNEVREISEGLRRSNERERFELKTLFATRIVDLRRGLLDCSPQIVHFAGHGEKDGILLDGDDGRPRLVPLNALAELFGLCRDHVECVVLNACHSDVQAEAIAEHIPFVIGMSAGISDQAATEFAVAFYDALGAGRPIEVAFEFGRNAIEMADLPEGFTPILIGKKAFRNGS